MSASNLQREAKVADEDDDSSELSEPPGDEETKEPTPPVKIVKVSSHAFAHPSLLTPKQTKRKKEEADMPSTNVPPPKRAKHQPVSPLSSKRQIPWLMAEPLLLDRCRGPLSVKDPEN